MASLTKTTLLSVHPGQKQVTMLVEQIHPDAWPFTWLEEQDKESLKNLALTRILKVLEINARREGAFYQDVFKRAWPVLEEETLEPDTTTEISEYSYLIFEALGNDLIADISIVEQDYNDNWAKGLVKNFHPLKTEGLGLPFAKFEIQFHLDTLTEDMAGLYDCTYLDICDLS